VTATYATGGESGASIETSITTTAGSQTVTISWNGIGSATGYKIYRGLASGGELFLLSVSAATTSYNDNGTVVLGSATPPPNTQDDVVQEIALNEAMQEFDYYPASMTSSTAVWYLYYWARIADLTTEGQIIQLPTSRIYVQYVKYSYYLKRSVTEPMYLQMATTYMNQYTLERARLKGQDRRDVGTPRRFESEGRIRKSFRR
jgi:hypothetical protein